MNQFLQSLQGYKTHSTCAVVILMLLGQWAKLWVIPVEVYGALVAMAMMFLRSGVSRETGAAFDTPADHAAATNSPRTDGPGAAGKPILSLLLVCGLGLMMVFLAGVALSGCGTTSAAKMSQAEKIVITSVNDAMQEWAAYVNAGKATQKEIDTVRTAYNSYYDAQQVAKAAMEKLIANDPSVTDADKATAEQAVTNAESAVLAAVNQIIKH